MRYRGRCNDEAGTHVAMIIMWMTSNAGICLNLVRSMELRAEAVLKSLLEFKVFRNCTIIHKSTFESIVLCWKRKYDDYHKFEKRLVC